jgi:hypothetical protein
LTKPLEKDASEVVLTGPASPALAGLDDLAGKEVFVRKSSSYYESIVALNRRLAAEGRPAITLKEAPEELEDEDLIEMVNAGLVSIIIVDRHKAHFWKQVFPKVTVHDNISVRTGAEIAWAFRKDSPQLKGMLDEFAVAATSGAHAKDRAVILRRYLKNAKYVKSAALQAERKKFLELVETFQKYGDKYDIDWLLMAAQGYQESQLNQSARSPVGAIGVMQIMPATGKELAVGDITKTEPNHQRRDQVHALHDRPILRGRADERAGQGVVLLCVVQRRPWQGGEAQAGSTEDRPQPERLVPQCGICRGEADRPGDRHLRLEYLQVLRRVPPDDGIAAGTRAGEAEAEERSEVDGPNEAMPQVEWS